MFKKIMLLVLAICIWSSNGRPNPGWLKTGGSLLKEVAFGVGKKVAIGIYKESNKNKEESEHVQPQFNHNTQQYYLRGSPYPHGPQPVFQQQYQQQFQPIYQAQYHQQYQQQFQPLYQPQYISQVQSPYVERVYQNPEVVHDIHTMKGNENLHSD